MEKSVICHIKCGQEERSRQVLVSKSPVLRQFLDELFNLFGIVYTRFSSVFLENLVLENGGVSGKQVGSGHVRFLRFLENLRLEIF